MQPVLFCYFGKCLCFWWCFHARFFQPHFFSHIVNILAVSIFYYYYFVRLTWWNLPWLIVCMFCNVVMWAHCAGAWIREISSKMGEAIWQEGFTKTWVIVPQRKACVVIKCQIQTFKAQRKCATTVTRNQKMLNNSQIPEFKKTNEIKYRNDKEIKIICEEVIHTSS